MLIPENSALFCSKRKDLLLMAADQIPIGTFVTIRLAVFHAVFFPETLDLAVAEHGQTGKGGQQGAGAEIFVAIAELGQRCLLIRVIHEIDKALEDFRIELQHIFQAKHGTCRFLHLQKMHEGTVVNPVHAQRAHKIRFHQPESFGQQQGVRNFRATRSTTSRQNSAACCCQTVPASFPARTGREYRPRSRAADTKAAGSAAASGSWRRQNG